MRMTTKFRQLLKEGCIDTVGVYDCLSAKLAEDAGFTALHLTGMGSEAAMLGAPDVGVMTMTELVSLCSHITSAINIPLLADIDTGFGGLININRTIREMERAGVAGVHIEDQALPKHCPSLAPRQVVDREEAVSRVKAALNARTDPDFVIVARTDADCISYDEVIERCKLFLEAGADMVMPIHQVVDGKPFPTMSPDEQMEFLRRLAKDVNGPIMGMGCDIPKGYTVKDMEEAGFKFVMSVKPARVVANTLAEFYSDIKKTGNVHSYIEAHPGPYFQPKALANVLNLEEYIKIEQSSM